MGSRVSGRTLLLLRDSYEMFSGMCWSHLGLEKVWKDLCLVSNRKPDVCLVCGLNLICCRSSSAELFVCAATTYIHPCPCVVVQQERGFK